MKDTVPDVAICSDFGFTRESISNPWTIEEKQFVMQAEQG